MLVVSPARLVKAALLSSLSVGALAQAPIHRVPLKANSSISPHGHKHKHQGFVSNGTLHLSTMSAQSECTFSRRTSECHGMIHTYFPLKLYRVPLLFLGAKCSCARTSRSSLLSHSQSLSDVTYRRPIFREAKSKHTATVIMLHGACLHLTALSALLRRLEVLVQAWEILETAGRTSGPCLPPSSRMPGLSSPT